MLENNIQTPGKLIKFSIKCFLRENFDAVPDILSHGELKDTLFRVLLPLRERNRFMSMYN